MTSLHTLPDHRARIAPDAACLDDSTTSLSNTDFLHRVRDVAAALRWHGVKRNTVVALRLTNRVDFVVSMFAAWRLGAAITPINPALTSQEAQFQLTDSQALILLTDDTLGLDIQSLDPGATKVAGQTFDADDPARDTAPRPHDLALLIYTSGTTGKPKGVMLTHANLEAMVTQGRTALDITADDHCLLILPLFHVNGIVVSVLTPLAAGGRTTIVGKFDPTTFFDTLASTQTTYFSAVPTILSMLCTLDAPIDPDAFAVRFVVCGAAPASPELLERFQKRFGVPVLEGYGLSEATCASTLNPLQAPRPGTVGRPLSGQTLRIKTDSPDDADDPVVGEILISGPTVMAGYLNQPELTASTIVDGWLHTGDLGYLDEQGYLVIVGRVKDMIIRGGENIYPKEIEDVLAHDDNVLDAAVLGHPDDKWGEVVHAYVAPRPGKHISIQALNALCVQRLSPFKRPIEIHILDQLPKNATGKIDKNALRNDLVT